MIATRWPVAYQEKDIVAISWAQRLEAGQVTNGVLRGPVENEACAALLTVLKHEDDSLQQTLKSCIANESGSIA